MEPSCFRWTTRLGKELREARGEMQIHAYTPRFSSRKAIFVKGLLGTDILVLPVPPPPPPPGMIEPSVSQHTRGCPVRSSTPKQMVRYRRSGSNVYDRRSRFHHGYKTPSGSMNSAVTLESFDVTHPHPPAPTGGLRIHDPRQSQHSKGLIQTLFLLLSN